MRLSCFVVFGYSDFVVVVVVVVDFFLFCGFLNEKSRGWLAPWLEVTVGGR